MEHAQRLIGYARVSTLEQAREGISLEAQRERLKAYCVAQGAELVDVEADNGQSGSIAPGKRPGMARALARIRAGEADGLVALKLDRLSRSTRDVLDLADDAARKGWRLVSVSESLDSGSPTGRFTLTILAALAQLEREQTAERTRETLAHVARAGRARSRWTPYGFRTREGDVEVAKGDRRALGRHTGEQRALARIEALAAEGWGARRIVTAFNAEGFTNPRSGRPWTRGGVASILETLERRAAL